VFFQSYLYIKYMKRGVKQMFGVAGVLLLASGAFASNPGDSKGGLNVPAVNPGAVNGKKVATPPEDETADAPDAMPAVESEKEKPANDSPYAAIVERNIFALVPIPPPKDPDADVKSNTPPVNVTLSGITTIFGNTRAYFMVQDPPQPGKPPVAPESVMLTAGERRGKLEALEIDIKAGTVKIKNDGVISTITFPKHTETAGAPPPPGAGAPPGFAPGARRGGFTPGGAPGGTPGIPSRTMRGGGGGGGGGLTQNSPYGSQSPYGGASVASYGQSGGLYGNGGGLAYGGGTQPSIAAAPLNSNPGVNPQPGVNTTPQPQEPVLSPEEQTVMIEAQKAYARQQGDPAAIIFPPTEISESEGEGAAGGPPPVPK